MTETLLSQIKIIKFMHIKPNFSELQRIYDVNVNMKMHKISK